MKIERKNMEKKRPRVDTTNSIIRSVCLIEGFCISGLRETRINYATGFFFQYNERKFLITNKHVVEDHRKRLYPDVIETIFHQLNEMKPRVVRIPLYDSNNKKTWFCSNDDEIDVAIIDITDFVKDTDDNYYLTDNDITTSEETELAQQVIVIGFPKGDYDYINKLPITRKGTIASEYGVNFRGKPYFLIDTNLQEGTSGSPVFFTARTSSSAISFDDSFYYPPELIGIHSAEHENIPGLNIVYYIRTLIELFKTMTI